MRARVLSHLVIVFAVALEGCTIVRETSPQRTATEELLISTAADRAAEKLALQIPPNIKIYLNTVIINAQDVNYATAAIQDRLLRRGDSVVLDRNDADAIIEVRAGALSTDEHSTYIGLPALVLPVTPIGVSGGIPTPSVNVFKRAEVKAIAKFAATAFDPQTGKLAFATTEEFGSAQKVDWAVLLLFAWTRKDYDDGSPPPRQR